MSLHTRYGWTYALRAEAYRDLELNEEALADFDVAAELGPFRWFTFWRRATLNLELRNYESAQADFDRAVELAPGDVRIAMARADFYAERGENELAIAEYQRASELNPKLAKPYIEQAKALHADGRDDEEIAALDAFVKIAPQEPYAYSTRAETLARLEDWEGAEEDFEQFLRRGAKLVRNDSSHGAVFAKLAQLNVILGDTEGYAEICRQTQTICAGNPRWNEWLVRCCAFAPGSLDDLEPVVSVARKLSEQEPENTGHRHRLAALLYRSERYDEAVKIARDVLDSDWQMGTRFFLAMSLKKLAREHEALDAFQRANHEFNQTLRANYYWSRFLTIHLAQREAHKLFNPAE